MTDLEDRLRRHLKIHSERIGPESVRPLRVPPPRRRSATVRWLAPVAAVAAVIALIAGVSVAGQSAGSRSAAGTVSGMPPYYVTLTGATRAQGPVLTATVRDSATGAALTAVGVPVEDPKVSLPKHTAQHSKQSGSSPLVAAPMPSGISAAADGRTFAITDDLGFFLLRVAASGRAARLTRLPINASNMGSDTAALSPDGSQLAIDIAPCPRGGCLAGIEVVSLATGASKVWLGPSMAGSALSPAWVDNGQELMFLWQVGNSSTPQGYRLLNISGGGGGLLASSQPMTSPPVQNGWNFPGAVLTPDGSALITTDYRNVPGPDGRGTAYLRVVELSASTGRLLRVLHTGTAPYSHQDPFSVDWGECNVLSLGPSGLHALVQCPSFGRIDGGKFTSLPGIPVGMSGMTGVGGTAAW